MLCGARALCEEGTVLSGAPPWQWPAWWANAVKLGEEMGEPFARSLLSAAGVKGDALDLSQKLGGDRPTVQLHVLCVLLGTGSMTECKLRNNNLGLEGWTSIFNALHNSPNSRISTWDLSGENLGPEIAKLLANYIAVTALVTCCNVLNNNMDVASAQLLVEAVKSKDVSLAGIKPDQTEANFRDQGLKPPDAVLLALDLSKAGVTGSSMTSVR